MEGFSVLLQLLDQLVDDLLRPLVDGRVHLLAHEVGQLVFVRQRLDLVYRRRDAALHVRHHRLQLFRLANCLSDHRVTRTMPHTRTHIHTSQPRSSHVG